MVVLETCLTMLCISTGIGDLSEPELVRRSQVLVRDLRG